MEAIKTPVRKIAVAGQAFIEDADNHLVTFPQIVSALNSQPKRGELTVDINDLCKLFGLELRTAKDKQAAARIEELEKACRWIPVSERLPEKTGYINVADAKLKIPQTWYWTNTNTEAERLKAFMTHWKPIILPEQAALGEEGKGG